MNEKIIGLFGLGTRSGPLYPHLIDRGWEVPIDTERLADYPKMLDIVDVGGLVVVHVMNSHPDQMRAQAILVTRTPKNRVLLAGRSQDGFTSDQIKNVAFLENKGYQSVSRDSGLVEAVLRFIRS